MPDFVLTSEVVAKVLKTVDAGLVHGLGRPKPGSMCVEAAVCYALGLPHGDDPLCVDPVIRSLKIRLNDSSWSSREARAKGLRRLAVLQLGTKGNFNSTEFSKILALRTITHLLPEIFRIIGLETNALQMESVTNLDEGRAAARAGYAAAYAAGYAAADAAYAARAAYAAYAARAAYAANADRAAAYAAYAAADAAAASSDRILQKFSDIVADILVDMSVPAVSFLSLMEK